LKKIDQRISIPNLRVVYAIYRYENGGVLQKVVKSMKYRFLRGIPELFEKDILDCLNNNFDKNSCVLIPVPLHPAREKWRGFNQAFELVKNLGWEVRPAIRRVKNTTPQAELPRHARLQNLNGAFSANASVVSSLLNKKIILIDDVCTTGATLSECAKVIKKLDIDDIYGLVLGHGK